jgi:hypothetical protein
MNRSHAISLVQAEISRICDGDQTMTVRDKDVLERTWGWYIPWSAQEDSVANLPPAPGIQPFIVLRETSEAKMIQVAMFKESVRSILGEEIGNALLSDLAHRK